MKRIQRVQWEKTDESDRPELRVLFAEAVWETISILLLIFAAFFMLSCLSYHIAPDSSDAFKIIMIVTFTVMFYEVSVRFILSRIKGKTRKYLRLLFAIVPFLPVLLLLLIYYRSNYDEIRGGLAAAATFFLKPYNRIFGSNIVIRHADNEYISMGLTFTFICIFFAFYFISRLGKRKWLYLLLPLASTAILMYVGLAPEWIHIVLYAGGIFMMFRKGWGRGWFVSAATSLAVFMIICIVAGFVLLSPAEKVLDYADEIKEFQNKIEKSIESLFSRVFLSTDKTLDNSSPRYKDAKIMTVTMDTKPSGNLYFKEFYGVDYEDGTWKASTSDLVEACKDYGIDPEEVAIKLAGAEYDNKRYDRADYEIEYSGLLGQAMLLPYAVDTDGISGLSFKGDYVAKKEMTKKKVSFSGLDTNTFVTKTLLEPEKSLTSKDYSFWGWYGNYVNSTCLYVPEYIFKTRPYRELEDRRRHRLSEENEWRLDMAKQVKEYLDEHYTYSWELDSLDSEEDPLEYFLKKGREGYCMHFASAGTIILRSLGVPARYASGYVLKPYMLEEDDGKYTATVRDRNAHAWVEIYFDNIGWIPFEVTPGYESKTDEFPASKEAQEQRKEEEEKKKNPSPTPTEAPTEAPIYTPTPKPTNTVTPVPSGSEKKSPTPAPTKKAQPSGSPGNESSSGNNTIPSPTPAETKENKGNLGKVLLVLFIISLFIAALSLIFRAKRKALEKIEDSLKNKYYRAAVKMMNRRVYRRLRRKGGIKGRNTTDKKLEETLLEVLGEDRKNEIDEYMRVVKKAAFSENAVSKAESEVVARLYRLI